MTSVETSPDAPTLTYHAPDVNDAGFSFGQPVLNVHLDGAYAGCLFRSYRNEGRRLVETWQLHLKRGKPSGPKFETLEELVLFTQAELGCNKTPPDTVRRRFL